MSQIRETISPKPPPSLGQLEIVLLSTQNTDMKSRPVLDIWVLTRENLYLGFANNKGVYQPAHPRRLISPSIIRLLKCIITRLATSGISFFYLVFVAELRGWSEPHFFGEPEDRFCHVEAHMTSGSLVYLLYLQKTDS